MCVHVTPNDLFLTQAPEGSTLTCLKGDEIVITASPSWNVWAPGALLQRIHIARPVNWNS